MELTAGCELDALVAEQVMGMIGYNNLPTITDLEKQLDDPKNVVDILPSGECRVIRPYSTDIAAAWEVVEKLAEHYDWRLDLDQSLRDDRPHMKYLCTFYLRNDSAVAMPVSEVYAPTMPLAICLAALKAVGVNLEEKESVNG